MRNTQFIQISIPDPCAQNWDEMTPCSGGRFCGHCHNTVIDFTTWTDAELFRFFSKKPSGVCGRYLATQLDRPIRIPSQPHSRLYRITVALGLTLLVAQMPATYAQSRPPRAAHTHTVKKRVQPGGQTGEICGRVLDEHNEPAISAAVWAYKNGRLMGDNATDVDGNYSIKPLEPGNYELVVRYMGFDSAKVHSIKVVAGVAAVRDIQMPAPPFRERVIIRTGGPMVDYRVTPVEDISIQTVPSVYQRQQETKTKETFDPPGKTTIRREDIDHSPVK